jgi:hypothetical protein
MAQGLVSSFAVRLRDLLSTLEATTILGAAEIRMRGLGEQLQFACLALPCDQALVALELASLGRLTVPGVASADSWHPTELEFLPSGTPFAYLLGGGSGYGAELEEDDEMVQTLAPVLSIQPRHALFVPVRAGGTVVGGAALLSEEAPLGDAALTMAERLGEVLSLTIEAHRSERVLLQLFATVLPDLCGSDPPTDFPEALARHVHQLRMAPEYRFRLELAESIGKLAAHGEAEARLARDLVSRVERYLADLTHSRGGEDGESDPLLSDELYE